jgi:hypothetical protein
MFSTRLLPISWLQFLAQSNMEEPRVSQGQNVMAEIRLIRAALTQQGYRLQKLPRQAVWMICFDEKQSYRLTYQPAPVNTWVVHPPSMTMLLTSVESSIAPLIVYRQPTLERPPRNTSSSCIPGASSNCCPKCSAGP